MWAQANELFKKYFGTRPITPLHNLCPSKPIFTCPKDGWTDGWLRAWWREKDGLYWPWTGVWRRSVEEIDRKRTGRKLNYPMHEYDMEWDGQSGRGQREMEGLRRPMCRNAREGLSTKFWCRVGQVGELLHCSIVLCWYRDWHGRKGYLLLRHYTFTR